MIGELKNFWPDFLTLKSLHVQKTIFNHGNFDKKIAIFFTFGLSKSRAVQNYDQAYKAFISL